MWGDGSVPSSIYTVTSVPVLPRMSATSTSNITFEYTIDMTGSGTCRLSIVDVELTSTYPPYYKITGTSEPTHEVSATASVARTTKTGAYLAGGSIGAAGWQQFGVMAWVDSGFNGTCVVTVHSVRSSGLELLNTGNLPITYSPATISGGGGGSDTIDYSDTFYTLAVYSAFIFGVWLAYKLIK